FPLADARLLRVLLAASISILAVLGATITTQNRVPTDLSVQQSPYYTLDAVPGSLTLMQGSTAQAVITITSLNGFSETTRCGSALWGHLDLRASVSPSAILRPFAVVNPPCLTLKSGETAAATLVVSTTGLEAPGINHVSVSVGFRVSPSGWSAGSSTAILVHIIPDEPQTWFGISR